MCNSVVRLLSFLILFNKDLRDLKYIKTEKFKWKELKNSKILFGQNIINKINYSLPIIIAV